MFSLLKNRKLTKNDIIMCILTLANMANIIFNCKQNILPTIITFILIAIHYYTYDFDKLKINRRAFLITVLLIGLSGPIMESIIIHFTKGNAWRYGNPFMNWYVPLWLFPGYGMLGMSCVHYYFSNL